MDTFLSTTPFFTDAHRSLADRMSGFVEREIEVRAADDEGDADEALRSYVLLLAENDLLRHSVATPGQPFDLRAFCIVRESLSYSSSLADLAFVMQGLGTYAISLAATEHVRDFWLARARTGKAIAAFALTEPDAGSDVAALKTTAEIDDDSYLINGRKRFISNAGVADFYTVFARHGDARRWSRGNFCLDCFRADARFQCRGKDGDDRATSDRRTRIQELQDPVGGHDR